MCDRVDENLGADLASCDPIRMGVLAGALNETHLRELNRVHFDLRPDRHQQAEVRRLEGRGARRIDIGQVDVPWVVTADPEGNEFLVLRSLAEKEGSLGLNGG